MSLIIRTIAVVGFVVVTVITGRVLLFPEQGQSVEVDQPKSRVRVASRDLPVGTFLDEIEAPLTAWDKPVTEDMLADPIPAGRDVIGAVIIAPIAAGSPISRSQMLLPGQDGFLAAVLGPGMRAVSVAVDAVSGNAGLIFPGDRVDLILTHSHLKGGNAARSNPRWASETILQDVRVIAVDQNLRSDLTQRDGGGSVARTITLEVQPREAEKVALASGLGKLSLSLRSLLIDEMAEARAEVSTGAAVPGSLPPHAQRDLPRPTWAEDVSLVIRSANQSSALPEQAAPPRRVRIFRGNKTDDFVK